jgi:hypothetical protein
MARLTEETLGGKVHLDFMPEGLSWTLACPASRVLEA